MGSTSGYLPTSVAPASRPLRPIHRALIFTAAALFALSVLSIWLPVLDLPDAFLATRRLPPHITTAIARCNAISQKPGPPSDFHDRTQSDRFVPGTKPTLLKNAKIWTGLNNGTDVIHADILLDKGLIKNVGQIHPAVLSSYKDDLVTIDLKNAWVTPGIVDLHSHLGDSPSPELNGAIDDNSLKGTTQPWLRALDGLNTHDESYALSISGGVTTALVLPGSANAIGGQGFTIKLRKTEDRSPSSLLLEPPFQINSSFLDVDGPPRWRQMKHACGENPSGVYQDTRMDTIWAFRKAYDEARRIRDAQDAFCASVHEGRWDQLRGKSFPEELQWEALVDVLRGRVKIQVHCYETVDLDALVRLSNEFQFPIAAVHHAHEAYLVPDVLKRAYDHPPGVAMFATNARYKREAFRGSEFAPRILAEHGLKVVMKSDHPVLDSRYLLYEAQQAYLYGLPENLAIASVTSTPAGIMGMDHRVGYIRKGWDADLVVWDSHPLALGATPKQVFIDGIAQLSSPHSVHPPKPHSYQVTPRVPNFDKEAREAVEYEGLPPLQPEEESVEGAVVFLNVRSVFGVGESEKAGDVVEVFRAQGEEANGAAVVVEAGSIKCIGSQAACFTDAFADAKVVDTEGGSIAPGLVTFGAPIGLEEIDQEKSTGDGVVYDPLVEDVPAILGADEGDSGIGALVRAVDGLQFGTRNALLAYRAGVTTAITVPKHRRFFAGLGTWFSTGARHKLAEGAVVQETTAVHVTVRHFGGRTPSVSTQIAALRRLLLADEREGEAELLFGDVSKGKVTLVVEADSADIIATLVLLKKEVEEKFGSEVKLTITGALEAHILAKEIASANIGIVQVPARPFPTNWERLRILPGHPLSENSSLGVLLAHNVTVGIGIEEGWSARNTRFDIGWAAIDLGRQISEAEALALGSTNVEKLLGGDVEVAARSMRDMVVTRGGGLLEFGSKVVAVLSPRRAVVDLL